MLAAGRAIQQSNEFLDAALHRDLRTALLRAVDVELLVVAPHVWPALLGVLTRLLNREHARSLAAGRTGG
jgi:hypothetical protein